MTARPQLEPLDLGRLLDDDDGSLGYEGRKLVHSPAASQMSALFRQCQSSSKVGSTWSLAVREEELLAGRRSATRCISDVALRSARLH
jgi:hypothetical protein